METEATAEGIAYTEVGAACRGRSPRFVLVHGLGGARQQWLPVQRALGARAHTIAVDVPGFGLDRGPERFEVHRASDRVAGLIRARGLEDAVLVSHSIGSTVAAILAARPDMCFSRVILVSGPLFRATEVAQRPWRMATSGRLGLAVAAQFVAGAIPVTRPARRLLGASRLARRTLLWPFVARPGDVDPAVLVAALIGSGSPAVLRVLIDAHRVDYPRLIGAIPQPVDLVWGSRDRLIGPVDITRAGDLCKVVNLHEIDDCGHWPMIEKTAELASTIWNWGSHERSSD